MVHSKAVCTIDSDAEEGSDESEVQTESEIGMEEAAVDKTSYVVLNCFVTNVLYF